MALPHQLLPQGLLAASVRGPSLGLVHLLLIELRAPFRLQIIHLRCIVLHLEARPLSRRTAAILVLNIR